MEILSNFISIYCYIAFIIGAVIMLVSLAIAAMGKDNEPRNKVRFFVERVISDNYFLYINGKDKQYPLASERLFKDFGLNPDDFADMEVGEIREVYLDLED